MLLPTLIAIVAGKKSTDIHRSETGNYQYTAAYVRRAKSGDGAAALRLLFSGRQ